MMDETFTNHTDYSSYTNHSGYNYTRIESVLTLVENIVVIIGLPLALLSIVAVFFQARKDHGTPVYIINLLISDVIQLCCLAAWWNGKNHFIIDYMYSLGLMASIGFMVCISLERYLVVTKPLWYRFRRDIRITVMVCVGVWTLPLAFIVPFHFLVDVSETVFAVFHLLPLPLLIFFLVGTLKALSAARSVPVDEKRRIVAILVAVLLIYMLLFLPYIIWRLGKKARDKMFQYVALICIRISPLADLILYFFIRKGAIDTLLKFVCCKMSDRQETKNTDNEVISGSRTEAV